MAETARLTEAESERGEEEAAELDRRLTAQARVRINPGAMYGAAGEGFIRVNIACPRALLREGIKRMTDLLTR